MKHSGYISSKELTFFVAIASVLLGKSMRPEVLTAAGNWVTALARQCRQLVSQTN